MTDVERNAILGNVQRQYVGARYVPKFFQGPDGTPTWVGNVPYEALTIVTYLGNSYTSKVPVPAGIGNPSQNPKYWALTGNFNAQLDNIISQLTKNSSLLTFTTPEYYGAAGDGVKDDTVFIQQAINSGSYVIALNTYKISSPLIIDSNCKLLIKNLICAASGIDITGVYNEIHVEKITGNGQGYGIKLHKDTPNTNSTCSDNHISIVSLENFSNGIELYSDYDNGVQYNYFDLPHFIGTDICVYGHCGGHGLPWINQNSFHGGRLRGKKGVVFKRGSTQRDYFNMNNFYNTGFEGLSVSYMELDYCSNNRFENIRSITTENEAPVQFILTQCFSNLFLNAASLNITKIQDTGNTQNTLQYNVFSAPTILRNVDNYVAKEAYSFNGLFFKEIIDWGQFKIGGYNISTNLAEKLGGCDGLYYTVGVGEAKVCTHTLTKIMLLMGKYFVIDCKEINANGDIQFLSPDGNVLFNKNQLQPNTIQIAVNTANGWILK